MLCSSLTHRRGIARYGASISLRIRVEENTVDVYFISICLPVPAMVMVPDPSPWPSLDDPHEQHVPSLRQASVGFSRDLSWPVLGLRLQRQCARCLQQPPSYMPSQECKRDATNSWGISGAWYVTLCYDKISRPLCAMCNPMCTCMFAAGPTYFSKYFPSRDAVTPSCQRSYIFF